MTALDRLRLRIAEAERMQGAIALLGEPTALAVATARIDALRDVLDMLDQAPPRRAGRPLSCGRGGWSGRRRPARRQTLRRVRLGQ